ncbi:TPA: hypothetical protein N0F65_004781 [Lagenidium giganteum]|uniref:Kinesin-like protein n=1 Tax=Lagenidium giganteum TaxID=4803 RepID=A0AAV2Z761_9STRA|nr:TPA: hypothetical protein N0F65_004781 [Lagenidium giganteum]
MTEHSALQVVDLTADNSPRSGATAVSAIAAVTSAAAVTTTASAPTSRSLLEDDDNDAASKCSICVEEVDYRGSALVQCHRCKLRVHVKCYGTSLPTDDSPWVCEACLYFTGADNTNEPATVQRIPPQCVICPITGGALRRTTQSGAWCHVLCVNWIPELSHSLPDTLDTPLDISMLQPNRETLRCIVCGQKGGCIQCISGRCARAFHPICAQRAPSSLIFMGYNNDNQQVYHCKMHLSDIATRKFEMVDTTWKQKPMVKKFLLEHPEAPGKCRVCANKMAGREQKDRHEVQCLLGWVTREEATNRKKLMAKLGIKPVKIEYKAKSGGGDKGATPERSGGKKKRQHAAMKPCRECGELVQESLMLGHLRKRCPQATETKGRAKNPKNPGVMKRRNSGTPSDNQVVDLSQSESNVQSDLSDVLFATWPGQTSGSLMDSTHWWKVVNSNFFSGKNFAKRRMESTCRNACGARLDDIGNFTKKASEQAWTCTDTAIMDRRPEDPNTLSIKSMLHRCDFLMRMSRIRCMEDVQVRPLIDVEHIASSENGSTDPPSAPANATTTSEQNVMSVKVVFQNTENMAMSCKFSMHRPRKDGGSHKRPLGGAVWSQYQQNREVLLAGHIMQDPAYSQRQEELWIALEDCEEVDVSKFEQLPPMNITEPDELTPEINLLMAQLNEQLHTNRYGLRPLCHKLQLTDHAERILRNKASVTEAYYKEFVWWKCLSKCLMVGYKDVTKVVDTDKDATDAPTSDDNDDNENEEPIDDGTCVICFDGQSPESNPIIFCDRCDLAVHQRCYGVVEVPSSDFYCDCCQIEDDGEDPAVSVFCQLCSLRDGAFKKTVDGKWVHVVCALWCPGVWIGNLMSLTEIRLVGGVNKPRFVDNLHEVEARLTDTTPAMSASDATTMTMLHTQAPPLRHGSLCIFCRVACGRTIQCCEGVCGTSFHALCAWFHGLPMTITLTDHGFVYFGGGAGLKFQIHCESHLPERYSVETCRSEGKRRGRFRIDSFFVTQSKRERFSASRVEDPLLGGRIAKALLAELDPTGGQSHFTDREMCSACFEYESPVLDGEEIDVHKFSLRQFLVRCQYCNVYIHPACCSSEMDSPSEIYRSNLICERCTVLNGSSPQPCVICDQSSDYMMPCADADPSGQVAKTAKLLESQGPTNPSNGSSMLLLQNAMASQVPRHLLNQRLQQNNSQEQKLQQTRPVQYNKWVHAFCREWAKMKVARRHDTMIWESGCLDQAESTWQVVSQLSQHIEGSCTSEQALDSQTARLDELGTAPPLSQRIQVFIRVRPDSRSDSTSVTISEQQSTIRVQHAHQNGSSVVECTYDHVFGETASQEEVFQKVEPVIHAALQGYNATIFAYGPTGTGKTHTIFGNDNESVPSGELEDDGGPERSGWGVIPRAASYLLKHMSIIREANASIQVDLQCSFMQIYNDRLFDLLADKRRQKPLIIREQPTLDGTTQVVLQGLSSEHFRNLPEALNILQRGRTNRSVRETEGNATSSRSHAIVQFIVTSERALPNGDRLIRKSRLNVVDLAGSEKWNTDVSMEDAHSQELKNINASLSALGNCIAALAEAGRKHIPYRDSMLTRLLQDSFGGNTQASLIATVSPLTRNAEDTIRTLQFADRARSVMQTVHVNETVTGSSELLLAKVQIAKLRERLESEQRRRRRESESIQRDFLEKVQLKDKEIQKLAKENATISRQREEDNKRIRALESRIKDLEISADLQRQSRPISSNNGNGGAPASREERPQKSMKKNGSGKDVRGGGRL